MNMVRSVVVLLVIFLLAVVGTTLAAETGTALKADNLKAKPFRDAKTVGSLTAGEKVEILKKQGGWFWVASAKRRGWVHMLSIRRGKERKGSGDGAGVLGLASGRAGTGSVVVTTGIKGSGVFAGVLGLADGRAGTGSVVATTGIRGLNEKDLKAAKYDEAEFKKMESFTTTEAEIRGLAAEGKLVTRKVEYLSAPSATKGER